MALDKRQYHMLAQLGAQTRLRLIELERQQILTEFPDLRPPTTHTPVKPAKSVKSKRKSNKARKLNHAKPASRMTSAARKQISERMKNYWANRRAERQISNEFPESVAAPMSTEKSA